MKKKQIATIVFALWLMITAILMLQARLFDLEIFFMVCFIGFLVILELLEPRYVHPGCIRYKNYFLAAGTVIFFGIASQAVTYFLGLTLLQF
jgi:hypothetical protein